MARIAVIGTPFDKALLQDLEKRQTLREHTIHPPGQERYIRPVDSEGALTTALEGLGGTAVAAELAAFIAATVGADDISVATIRTAADAMTGISGTTVTEGEDLQDLLSYKIIETGHFLLSFHGGVIRGMLEAKDEAGDANPWIKVFTDAGDELFEL